MRTPSPGRPIPVRAAASPAGRARRPPPAGPPPAGAGGGSHNGFTIVNDAKFQGAVYAVNDFLEANNAIVWGPVIARQLAIVNSGLNHYVPLGTLLPGMPGGFGE